MKPWLYIPTNWAHKLGPFSLKFYSDFCVNPDGIQIPSWNPLIWRNLVFKNRLGIAGGVDKNAECLMAWWKFGAGFVEVGTVTPEAQEANPGKIIDRDMASKSLWNKMGFPGHGASEVAANLRRHFDDRKTPIFANIGKNRTTSNEDAKYDYLSMIDSLDSLCDVFVVNISSPNTQGLRELQGKEALSNLLGPLIEFKKRTKPLLVKLSPDMGTEGLEECVTNAAGLGVDGFVLTNTTLSRPPNSPYPPDGGMSGLPLANISTETLKTTLRTLGSQRQGKLIVSVGGVMTEDDVFERITLGADLVQTYSNLIFHGPGFLKNVARKAAKT